MANSTSGRAPLSPAVIAAAVVLVILILGFFGWKTLAGGASDERVKVDVNKVKEQFQQGGFGRH